MRPLITLSSFFTFLLVNAQLTEIEEIFASKPKSEETIIWLCDTAFTFYGNDPKLTMKIAELALEKAVAWDYDMAKARASHVIGISYWARDVYDSAILYYIDALEHYESVNLKRGIAMINLNIGTIYDDIGQPERGKSYLLKSIEVIRQENDSVNLGRGLNNIAVIYGNLGMRDSAIHYFRETMQIRKALDDSVGVARAFNNIADLYFDNGPNLKSEDVIVVYRNLVEAMKYIEEGDDNNVLTTIFANMGKSLMELGRMSEA